MTDTTAKLDLDRLAKLCGLFSSAHEGERASAAAQADALLRNAGMTWSDVIAPRWREPKTMAAAIALCLQHPDQLAEELAFLQKMQSEKHPLSPARQRKIRAHVDKLKYRLGDELLERFGYRRRKWRIEDMESANVALVAAGLKPFTPSGWRRYIEGGLRRYIERTRIASLWRRAQLSRLACETPEHEQ